MNVFTIENLTATTGTVDKLPWEFTFPADSISKEIRTTKSLRQEWYKKQTTKHCFYSGLIGHAATGRVGKENPPRMRWLFAADYDCPIPDERVKEVVEQMPIKPTKIENSLGGHRRLVWELEIPIYLETNEFSVFVSQRAVNWLRLNLLPMLDEPAWESTSRLLCCGDKWEATGYGPVPKEKVQAFFVECGKAYRFHSADGTTIGLDLVEAECKKRFPDTFSKWPGDFVLGSQGPSFWVTGSESPNSALVKPDGIFTFAGHADKPFYSWADILGKEFMKAFSETSIAKATADIWFDGLKFHRKNNGVYISMRKEELLNYFRVDCRLSPKPDQSGESPIEQALAHIYSNQRIVGAAPHVPLETGIIIFQNRRHLNTYDGKAVEPATGTKHWGPSGEFPFLSRVLDTLLFPHEQLDHLITWFHYYYRGVYEKVCRPGPMVIMAGQPGCGKSLVSRSLFGISVGGFCDAASFIIGGNQFNSELFSVPHWALDDDTPNASAHMSGHAHMNMKKLLANDVFMFSKKYEVPSPISWGGRLFVTANLDEISLRVVGPMDDAMKCRVMLLKCADFGPEKDNFIFPSRAEVASLLESERPAFLRYAMDWKVPDHIEPDGRYGYVPYKEPSLLDKANQSSPAATFKEMLIATLLEWFRQNEADQTWRGTSFKLLQLLNDDIRNQNAARSLKPEQVNTHLQTLERERLFGCHTETESSNRTRLWVFNRPQS